MKRFSQGASAVGCALLLLAGSVRAEIVILDDPSGRSDAYLYSHSALPSVVFVAPEARAQASSDLPIVLRLPAYGLYPPTPMVGGVNQPIRASNADNATYAIARARVMQQRGEEANARAGLWLGPASQALPYAGWYLYPPSPMVAGVNQPARPSNRDNTIHRLNRAHAFSMDLYRSP